MQSIVIPERLSMWFRVYCESLLSELECHVLWQDSSRLDTCTSLLFWIKKGRNIVWTAALTALACCGCLIMCARLNSQFKVLTIMSWYLFCELRKWITILSENARKPWAQNKLKRGRTFQFWRSQLKVAFSSCRKKIVIRKCCWEIRQ